MDPFITRVIKKRIHGSSDNIKNNNIRIIYLLLAYDASMMVAIFSKTSSGSRAIARLSRSYLDINSDIQVLHRPLRCRALDVIHKK